MRDLLPILIPALLWGCGQRSEPELEVPEGERCVVEDAQRWCVYDTVTLRPGTLSSRDVHFQVPVGQAPEAGWPVVLLFQGSLNPADRFWQAEEGAPWGAWHQVGVVQTLLESGYAVITPNAQSAGNTYWNTNVLPWAFSWEGSPDDKLMEALFEEMDAGTFGSLDPERRAAGGISSGGYMTSRMALSYPGEFDALFIQSASWATCGGTLCSIPSELPDDHPPTLFLHGETDAIVPLRTMEAYAEALEDDGVAVHTVTDPEVGHAWLEVAPDEVRSWLATHLPAGASE